MTTNCNDTCDAVDELLLCYSVLKHMDMWGSIPSSLIFSILFITLTQKTEMAFMIWQKSFFFFFFPSFQFQKIPLGAFNFSMLIEILHSHLKELSPKPSTAMVSFCVSMSLVRLSSLLNFAELRLTSQPTFQRMWTD